MNILAVTTALLSICITILALAQMRQPRYTTVSVAQPLPFNNGGVFLGHPLEPVLGIKVSTKEAGRVIVWAEDMGYKIGWDWYNEAGFVYIVFYRCMRSTIKYSALGAR